MSRLFHLTAKRSKYKTNWDFCCFSGVCLEKTSPVISQVSSRVSERSQQRLKLIYQSPWIKVLKWTQTFPHFYCIALYGQLLTHFKWNEPYVRTPWSQTSTFSKPAHPTTTTTSKWNGKTGVNHISYESIRPLTWADHWSRAVLIFPTAWQGMCRHTLAMKHRSARGKNTEPLTSGQDIHHCNGIILKFSFEWSK